MATSVTSTGITFPDSTTQTTAASGSAMSLISTQTVSSATSAVSWTGLSGYDKYFLIFESVVPVNSSQSLTMTLGYGAGPTYLSSGYKYAGAFNWNSNLSSMYTFNGGNVNLSNYYNLGSTGSSESYSGYVYINSATYSGFWGYQCMSSFVDTSNSAQEGDIFTGQVANSGNALTAIKLICGGGANIASGKFSLYGMSS